MIELLSIVLSAVLISLSCTGRTISVFKVILFSTLTFYIMVVALIHIAGYSNLFFNCGIKTPLFAGSLCTLLVSFFFFVKDRTYRKSIIKPSLIITRKENIIYLPIGILYTIIFISNLFFYPDSYDGNAYHLPLAIKFLQSNSFLKIPHVWQYTMPSNAESVFAFFALARNPILLNFSQFFLLCSLVLWNIRFNRLFFGLNRSCSLITSILLLSMPVVFQGAFFHYVDFFGTVFLYLSITTVILIQKRKKERIVGDAFLGGLFYGISVGTKLTFIVFGPLIGCLLLYSLYHRRSEVSTRASLVIISVFAASLLLLSLFWYIRNSILFGNPLFPLNLPQFNLTGVPIESIVNKGYDKRFTEGGGPLLGWLLYPFTELHPTGQYQFSFGPLFAIVILPGTIIATFYALMNLKRPDSSKLLLISVVTFGCIIFWYLFLSRQPRFIMIAPLLMTSCVGYVYGLIVSKKRYIHLIIFAFSTLLLVFYSVPLLSKVAFCIHYYYSPYNWNAYYKIPVSNDKIREKSILNLSAETMNFALYGPLFRNRVITTQEVHNTIYGEQLSYLDRQNLPPFSDKQIDILFQKYGDCYFYSHTTLNNKNLKLYSRGVDHFPRIKWLNTCIYVFKKQAIVQDNALY